MNKKFWSIFLTLSVLELIVVGVLLFGDLNFQILNPKGPVARQQKDLIFQIIGLMLIVAIPLLTTLYYFVYRYKEGGKKTYKPDERHSRLSEIAWWASPTVVVLVLAVITWNKTHLLDPYKSLASTVEPIRIQVVALNWKWLFLYPEYGIAVVNYIQFPKDTPVNFELTADAPMNSFWIPQLSGQIYAMTGMSTKLHIMADSAGDYRGQAVELNGRGYSGMKFTARASTHEEFLSWINQAKQSPLILNPDEYAALSSPSENNPVVLYGSLEEGLYEKIIMKFMSDESSGGAVSYEVEDIEKH